MFFVTTFVFLSLAQSFSLLSGVYSDAAESYCKNYWYVLLLLTVWDFLCYWPNFYCTRWPLPPWQCLVVVRIYIEFCLQCSLGSSSLCPEQDSQCNLVPGKGLPFKSSCNVIYFFIFYQGSVFFSFAQNKKNKKIKFYIKSRHFSVPSKLFVYI